MKAQQVYLRLPSDEYADLLQAFVLEMQGRLVLRREATRGTREDWHDVSREDLEAHLLRKAEDLFKALDAAGTASVARLMRAVVTEAANVANLAMMLADHAGCLVTEVPATMRDVWREIGEILIPGEE